jgi:hypothetical protein
MPRREGLPAARRSSGTMHADVNAGGQPMEVIVAELKKDK